MMEKKAIEITYIVGEIQKWFRNLEIEFLA
jgi:hypothetical protein